MMEVVTFRKLLSPAGQQVLQAAVDFEPREVDFLRHFTTLSRTYPPDLARAALEIAILRLEATSKFPFADRLYFTRPALEQASNYEVSTYRALRYRGIDRLADLGCSIGGDTLTLADLAPTIGVDLDPLRLVMAQANAVAIGVDHEAVLLRADLTAPLPFPSTFRFSHLLALFFDPGRRANGRRAFSIYDYHPPLDVIKNWLPHHPALGVKISPGVKLDELRAYDAEVEFISLRGELKEAVLWFGPFKTAQRRATVLPGPHTLAAPPDHSTLRASPTESGEPQKRLIPLSEPRAYLYEPDPSILRAGLVQALGVQLDAAQLDPDIAYLTTEHLTASPFARAWVVEDWFPFGIKRLRAALRERRVSQVTVKKRGSPLQPEELIRALDLKGKGKPGGAERVIFLTHLRGRPIVVLCFPSAIINTKH